MTEIHWKTILDYPDYEVSDHGGLRRVVANRGCPRCKELRPQKMNTGYMKCVLFKDGKCKQFSMHRLVLQAFVGPAPEGLVCNHKDGNRANNHIDNLEWITYRENSLHAKNVLEGWRGPTKVTAEQVREIRHLYATGEYTNKILGELYGVAGSAISNIIRRRNWAHIT